MRPMLVAGIALICLGLFLLLRGGSFTTQRDVVKVGDVKLTASEHRSVPPWAAGLGIILGSGLLFAGTRRRA
jgi:hypothetical protein